MTYSREQFWGGIIDDAEEEAFQDGPAAYTKEDEKTGQPGTVIRSLIRARILRRSGAHERSRGRIFPRLKKSG